MIVIFLKEIIDAFQLFKWYLATIENEIVKSLKILRSDNGGKFISNEFRIFYNVRGIKR